MIPIRPRHFHRLGQRQTPGRRSYLRRRPLLPAVVAAPELTRQQISRYVTCAVLGLVACGPVWVAGRSVVEMYRDEQASKTPVAFAPDRVRLFSRRETNTLAELRALDPLTLPSDAESPLADATDEPAPAGISFDLAGTYLPGEEAKLSLLAPRDSSEAFALATPDRALTLAPVEQFTESQFNATAGACSVAAVPEPTAWAWLSLGLAGTFVAAVRRRLF